MKHYVQNNSIKSSFFSGEVSGEKYDSRGVFTLIINKITVLSSIMFCQIFSLREWRQNQPRYQTNKNFVVDFFAKILFWISGLHYTMLTRITIEFRKYKQPRDSSISFLRISLWSDTLATSGTVHLRSFKDCINHPWWSMTKTTHHHGNLHSRSITI